MNLGMIPLDYPTKELKNSDGLKEMLGEIPAVVYQTWVTKRLTRRFHKSISKFRALNPELSFVIFDDEGANNYMRDHWKDRDIYSIYRDAKFGPMKADIFRYCILHDKGGFYFDLSKGLTRPISEFIDNQSSELLTAENNQHQMYVPKNARQRLSRPENLFVQWGFGFSKKHELLSHVITSIEENQSRFRDEIYDFPKGAILDFTGPNAFTRAVWQFLLGDETRQLNQKGIDFCGSGILSLKGSGGRYRQSADYLFAKPGKILSQNLGGLSNL